MKKLFLTVILLLNIMEMGFAQVLKTCDFSFIDSFPMEYQIDIDGILKLYPTSRIIPLSLGGHVSIPYEGLKYINSESIFRQRIKESLGVYSLDINISGFNTQNSSASKGNIEFYMSSEMLRANNFLLNSQSNFMTINGSSYVDFPTQRNALMYEEWTSALYVNFLDQNSNLKLYFTDDISVPFSQWHYVRSISRYESMPISIAVSDITIVVDNKPIVVADNEMVWLPYKGYYLIFEENIGSLISNVVRITEGVTFSKNVTPEIWPEDKPIVINNWVKNTIYTQPNAQTSVQDIVYYDGLGRPMQNIQIQASAGTVRKNIVSPVAYDAQGRDNAKTYLPYVSSNTTASLDNGQFAAQKSYYSSKFSATDAAYAYSENIFDPSPLNKVRKTYNVGSAYRTAAKSVNYGYSANSANEVLLLSVDPSSLRLAVSKYYDAGKLYKNTITNEDGQKVITYTDQNENLILERVVVSPTQNSDTYFAYDDFGQLCWVISPEGSAQLSVGQIRYATDAIVDTYCYIYKYGGLGRLLEKKLPGKGWEYMVYDKGGRLVMYQDAGLRSNNWWLCSVYDNLNRIVEQKISASTALRVTIQSVYDSSNSYSAFISSYPLMQTCYAVGESMNKSGTTAYYAGGTAVGSSVFNTLAFQGVTGVADVSLVDSRINGLLLYEKMYTVDNDLYTSNPKYVERAYYYDTQGRVIQTVEKNHLGGISRNSFKYDFVGNILTQHESHQKASGATADVVVRQYTYDHRSRLLSETTSLNGGTAAVVSYSYDDLGVLTGKTYGTGASAKTETYAYNIQGWLTSQNSDLFETTLRYFDTQYGTTKSYSGNIAEWEWKHKGTGATGQRDAYAFTYDNLGRLTDSKQYVNGTLNNKYTEQGISYDLNGNIKSLVRRSNGSVSDNFSSYSYSGNKLQTLTNGSSAMQYAYDVNGNCTTDGLNALNFDYNFLNLIGQVKQGSTVKASYRWSPTGAKLSARTSAGDGYDYLGSLVYKMVGGQLQLESGSFGSGRIIATSNGFKPHYFITDHLGSVRVMWDGATAERSDYYPFGGRWTSAETQANTNRYLYNGKESQEDLGLSYLDYGARMYDARIGRWHSVDPMAEKYANQSTYHFSGNNPINYIDLNGMDYWWTDDPWEIDKFLQGMNSGSAYDYTNWHRTSSSEMPYHMNFFSRYFKFDDFLMTYTLYENSIMKDHRLGMIIGWKKEYITDIFLASALKKMQYKHLDFSTGNISEKKPNFFEKINNSSLLGRIAYSFANDISVMLQSFIVTHPSNLDGSIAGPKEKLQSGINGLLNVVGPMTKGVAAVKTVNAGQFNALGIKSTTGKTITAATAGGMQIRQYNCVMRQIDGAQKATKITFTYGITFLSPAMQE